ncbi:DUF2254 family protein [Methanococcoides burtonii]|uniref:DUF2254 domain-containing protein n=1 Tax=Methanococcoides burtonii (strain DSM 6242 / NBRC 107633 / OCM 468 / ACE-M) TaxID=259564 RepID=Q12TZ8_METBU|nr:DUF2254 family protein [Methanococcoides burtonii]ABE53078.1 Hypothetical protein Mbur_2214 [Methanococcoides burtonii DSM 6242]
MISVKIIKEAFSTDVLHLWISRIAYYILLFLFSIGILHYINVLFGPSTYDMTSARYMISALIQSEAAIMAIIVSFSLVAVELASSSYSVRMIDLLRAYNPDFWILMVIYIGSMTYSLFVLKSIPGNEGKYDMQLQIAISFYTGVYSFLTLFPYLFRTLHMLKPSTLLNIQAMKLTAGSITTDVHSDAYTAHENDPIQPIIDIISSSLLNHDFETTRNGLNIIGMRAKEIFIRNNLEPTKQKIIANYIFSRLAKIGKFTLIHSDEDSTFIVIRNLEILWKELEKNDLGESVLQASSSLEQIGTVAADTNQRSVLSTVINHLYEIGQKAIDMNYDGESSRVIDSLGSVGVSCVNKRIDPLIVEEIINSIGKLGIKASESDQELSVSKSLDSMNALKGSMELIETPEYQQLCLKSENFSRSITKSNLY